MSDFSNLFAEQPFHVHQGDCIDFMATLPPACIDLAVFSPPFPLLYAYTDSPADIGNSEDLRGEAKVHLAYFFRQLARVLKPGRVAVCHCMQLPRLKRAGGQGLFDFRGTLVRVAERSGLCYAYDWLIAKNPQSQAIRTRSHELQFAGLEKDRARSRGALGDYLLKFIAPGENAVPVDSEGEVSRNEWIKWAEACWDDISETDTLNLRSTKDDADTRHICPLQLGVYERCIRLYSNPGDVVYDPFAGIGSCGFVALGGRSPKTNRAIVRMRRFLGCELKPSWREVALRNCQAALSSARSEQQQSLFGVNS